MTGLAMFAKPGAALRYGVPLGGGLLMLMGCGIASMCAPPAPRTARAPTRQENIRERALTLRARACFGCCFAGSCR